MGKNNLPTGAGFRNHPPYVDGKTLHVSLKDDGFPGATTGLGPAARNWKMSWTPSTPSWHWEVIQTSRVAKMEESGRKIVIS